MPHPLLGLALALLLTGTASAAPTPFWGAKQSSPASTVPAALKPGQWIWGGDNKAMGPMALVVSLTEQRAYAYRNGLLIGVTTISSGKPGHETPTGVFTILQKRKEHYSNLYNKAPMPYMQRLTWDGIALHAGGLPGHPASHGCVRLPSAFATRLFEATNMGMTVVVSQQGRSPTALVHPSAVAPIDPTTGRDAAIPPLDDGQTFRWQPEKSPLGPISMVLSRSDQRLFVLRNGVEIGRSRVLIREPERTAGTRAYIVGEGYLAGDNPQLPGTRMPNWFTIGIPGQEDGAGVALDRATIDRVVIPQPFVAQILPMLTPGVVLLVTDARVVPETTGGTPIQVLDSGADEG